MAGAAISVVSIIARLVTSFGLLPEDLPTSNTDYNVVRPYIADFGGGKNDGNPGTIDDSPAGCMTFAGKTIKRGSAGLVNNQCYERGSTSQTAILSSDPGAQKTAEVLQIISALQDDPGVCIVGLTMTTPDGAQQWGFSGDSWKGCGGYGYGYQWHWGGKVLFGELKGKRGQPKPYRPACMWLGPPGKGYNYFTATLGMSAYRYRRNESKKTYCKDKDFILQKKPQNGKRSLPASVRPYAHNLIVSDIPEHSARELCESPDSFGPDYINVLEGFYCDMENKTLHPLCTGNDNGNHCFDIVKESSLLRSSDESIKTTREYQEIVYHYANETLAAGN